MLIESLGTDDSPLLVHKMDTGTAVPSHNPAELLEIVRKVSSLLGPCMKQCLTQSSSIILLALFHNAAYRICEAD